MKKMLLTSMLVLSLIVVSTLNVKACTLTPNCVSTLKSISCGTRYGQPGYTHKYSDVNGNVFDCAITKEGAMHTIICAGCGARYGNEQRTCKIIHAKCGGTTYGVCQYQ